MHFDVSFHRTKRLEREAFLVHNQNRLNDIETNGEC